MIEQTEDYKTNITKLHDRADRGFRIKLIKPTSQNFMIEQTEDYKTNITKMIERLIKPTSQNFMIEQTQTFRGRTYKTNITKLH